jgi:site-specific DNA-methyltransferase (adenine-specific)
MDEAARYFYCAKASSRERNAGLEDYGGDKRDNGRTHGQAGTDNPYNRGASIVRNHHPTVKPLALMRYLARLTKTPTGGVVLDPFMGSGSTGCCAVMEGREFIGIDMDADYIEIARRRIAHWGAQPPLPLEA